MKIKLEVLASTCIKQKKPWPRITWLGEEKEAVFLLDDKNIQEINLLSGKTKKKIPQLQTFLKNVIILSTSRNGAWLGGMLKTGEIFLWNKDQDIIKTVPAIEESKKVAMAVQEHSLRLCLHISSKGNKILLATPDVCVLLWESIESNSTPSQISAMGQWSQIIPEASIVLPAIKEKETVVSADFIENEILGDCCLGSFAFYSEDQLMLTFLKIKWQENSLNNASSVPCQIHWAQQTCSLLNLAPSCESVKSRGALLTAFSHDGLVLAVALNQKDLQATQILFMSTKNFITTSGSLKGCGSKNPKIPSKLIRSYWISDMSWTPDSLFLVCMLKRGSLIIMTCLGELMTLITYGCSVEFGPAEFIPLHPLITHRSQNSFLNSHDSSVSEGDFMRQRFSVTCHSSLPYLIASDGYMVTVLKFSSEFSPSTYTKSLLLDSAQRLERLHHNLITFKSEGKKQPLQSLSSLRANLLQYENQLSTFSGTPKFLQEEEGATELIEEVSLFQECNEESSDDNFFQSNSYILGSQKADFTLGDEGQLEFASMFDTIHAIDGTDRKKEGLLFELNHIQKNLIAAWRVGTSRSIKEKDILLNFNIRCIVHFFNILQHVKLKELDHPVKNQSWIQCVLNCFHQFLTVLSWENQHRQTLGHLMKFTMQTLKLILAEQQDHLFSTNLLGGFSLLKMVIHYLNAKKIPQYEVLLADLNGNNKVELDSVDLPLFQSTDWNSHQKHCALHSMLMCSLPMANRTENQEKRLTVIWRHLYKHVIWYWAQLSRKVNTSNKSMTEIQITQEIPVTKALASHIQAILQSSGESLEQLLNLKSVNGEEEFLIGSYKKSVEAWERAFQETKAKGGKRIPFLQTRYYLAILYCHLYHYNISEAQGLCDHLVYELLKRNQISVRNRDAMTDAEWIKDIHTEAALAVVQSLARFMAAYFTNELIYILPPHSVGILPPLHIKPDGCLRIIPLQHSRVTEAVRDNGLSCTWTVEYTLDLLLISGLIPEAVWLAQKLGDWKMAVSIGVAYQLYCQSNKSLARSGKVELFLPLHLTPTNIFQEKLQSFLGQPVVNETTNQGTLRYKQLTDPIEEEDANALFSSVEQILKAAVMAEADILSETFQVLMDFAKDHSRKFCGLVPNGLYLPAPPLYCPQPTFVSEEENADVPLRIERDCRQKISGIVQRILLLFRAAHCSFAAAQWYIARLKHARRVMQKIHKKGALPPLSDLPENLLKYSKYQSVFLRPSSFGDHNFDAVSCKTIGCFRELCVLCWMLHVRERLSDSCRRYQRARENLENRNEFNTIEFDACIVEYSISALEWACRILPFARFMNIEELVQDIILSLIGELPPIKKVAEILVKAFPSPEDVRVSLRDKYNDLYQRLRHCTVKGPSSEEIMSVVLQATYKVNVKTLKRVIRNIGPIQTNIWEPPEEEIQDSGGSCYDRFSLGTTLSRSTISDFRNFQGCNNAEAADSLSEFGVAGEARKLRQEGPNDLPSCIDVSNRKEWTEKLKDCGGEGDFKKETRKDLPNQLHMPLVGEWEFERDDDEYIKFLDLFLTYVLERDPLNHSESTVPFLTCFAALLREHELHSLLFDVHTTLIRRQVRTEVQNAFRAGSCYTLGFGFSDSKLAPLWDKKKKDCEKETLTDEQPLELSDCDSVMRLTERRGLFGQSQQSVSDSHDSSKTLIFTPALAQCWSTPKTALFQKYICKTGQVNDVTQQDKPVPEIHLKFNNISRLLEWMIRWSSKRMVQDPITTGTLQEWQPMMQVKICSSAILSSLWILERRYGNTFQNQNCGLKPQKLCEKSSTIIPKLEKDGAEGTNSSSLEGAPAEIQNGHAYDEPFKNIPRCRTLPEKQNRKKVSHRGHSMVPNIDTGNTTVDISLAEKVAEFLRNEIVVPSETEVYNEDPVSRNPTISVSIKSVEKKKEHLSESKVECQQDAPLMETTEGKCTKLDESFNGATGEVVPNDFPLLFCSEKRAETTSVDITVSDDQPSFTEVSDIPSNNAGVTTEMIDRETTAQPPNTSEVVGQMLQDEMFKLIQLQQINYLSLMQIVGFANLPNTLQQMQQPQPFPLGRNRASNTEMNNIHRSPAMQPAGGIQKPTDHQQPTLGNNWNVGQKNNSSQEEKTLPDQSQDGNKTRSVHMNDSSALREGQSVGARLMLPLQSSLHQNPARPFPLLSVSLNAEKKPKLIPLAKPLNNAEGFPLLKLKTSYQFQALNFCPVTPRRSSGPTSGPREAWGPPPSLAQNPPNLQVLEPTNETGAHLNLNRYDQNIINQAQEQTKRWAEPVKTGISKQFPVDEYGKKEDSAPLQPFHERLRAEKPLVDNEINSHQAYGPFTEIPLLYLKTSPQSKCSPSTFTTKKTDCGAPLGQTGLPLLYSNLPPLTKFQIPKLIPLQDLIAFEQSQHFVQYPQHKDPPKQMQLLKANIKLNETRQVRSNKKRQKRRIENRIKEKEEKMKGVVTNQQDDSSVLPDSVKPTKETQAELSAGPCDANSLLKSDTYISSAALHYLASVGKKAIDLQDASTNTADLQNASTNTDTVLKSSQNIQTVSEELIDESVGNQSVASASVTVEKSHRDVVTDSEQIIAETNKNQPIISASASASASASETELLPSCVPQALPPELYFNFKSASATTETPLPSSSDLAEQRYISVTDIESGDLLKNLPVKYEPAAPPIVTQPVKSEFPASTKLYYPKVSITSVLPLDESERQEKSLEIELALLPPRITEEETAGDHLTSSLLHEDFSSIYTGQLGQKISRQHFSGKLQEMDRQLSYLQNLAEKMEKEYSTTKLFGETAKDVSVIPPQEEDDILFFAPGVQLCKAERYSTHIRVENFTEEKDFLEAESSPKDFIALKTPSVSPSVSAANHPRVNKLFSDISFKMEEQDERCSEDRLQITGLSDVLDIINDLIVENGVTPSELGLTEIQAKKMASRSNIPRKKMYKAEEDKKELHAWMKRKRKERLAEYMQTLSEKRAKEHSPFYLRKMPLGLSTREIKLQQKKKREKDKALLSEHHNLRVSEALSLMHDLLSDTAQLPSSKYKPSSGRKSSYDFKQPRIASAGGFHGRSKPFAKVGLGPARSFSNLSCDTARKKDRLCQTPYRRMLLEAHQGEAYGKSSRNQRQWTSSRLDPRSHAFDQTRESVNEKRFFTSSMTSQGTEETDDNTVSGWSVPEEIQQILYGTSNVHFKKESLPEDACSIASLNNIDSMSESTSSILSKLDWNAIEAMIANEEK
ncbi:ciliogenesis and planar polarity effector 1 isoform X3 [Pantherophis guttatus]|uniref:Ciliogenesis and planar polarity effector 1 isoform X3 n=1 Tax=Pantherophis guttatus TaxID=94885 RepID=A0A6P9E4N5_PANGU|nr:ciliogenesis and planar polarity effector 1 isoform X3 [Pantherophis guttatus]